jgi:hypothetical protein
VADKIAKKMKKPITLGYQYIDITMILENAGGSLPTQQFLEQQAQGNGFA